MFTVTPGASREILAAAERSDAIGMALRVAARQADDGSIEYGMGFDDMREDDESVDFAGVKVVLGAPSKALLAQTVLDYVEVTPGEHDFVFLQPTVSAPASGGCASAAGAAPKSGGCGGCGGGRCGS
jgi:iron-sulfur cluster assembly protein